jgi:periplasmic protein TonB
MVAREMRVNATLVHLGKTAEDRELLTEETTSVLAHENGGVIQLSTAVLRGQLLLLNNLETKREVVAQVKRTYQPMNRCVELVFAEPAPRFWGMEFSAATALLPRPAQDTEAASLLSEEAKGEDPGETIGAPSAEAVEALKREVRGLRQNTEAPSGRPLAVEREFVPMELTAAEEAQLPRPALDFTVPLPKRRGVLRARGKFMPGAGLRLAALTVALAVVAVGAMWFKQRASRRSDATRIPSGGSAVTANVSTAISTASGRVTKASAESNAKNAANDAPKHSLSNAPQPAGQPVQPVVSSASLPQPAIRKAAPSPTPIEKAPYPAVRTTSGSISGSPAEGIVVPPKLIKSVRAVASLDDLRDFETGNVVIDAVVDTDGEVHFLTVISGPPSLRPAAVRAVKQYRYEPATRNGQPVPEHVHITIRFRFES